MNGLANLLMCLHGPQAQAHKGKRQGPKGKGRLMKLTVQSSIIFLVRTFSVHSIAVASGRRDLQPGSPWRPDQLGVAICSGAKVGRVPYLALPSPPPLLVPMGGQEDQL
jgi:hypothetical protein